MDREIIDKITRTNKIVNPSKEDETKVKSYVTQCYKHGVVVACDTKNKGEVAVYIKNTRSDDLLLFFAGLRRVCDDYIKKLVEKGKL